MFYTVIIYMKKEESEIEKISIICTKDHLEILNSVYYFDFLISPFLAPRKPGKD